jgi:hypothetical protein
VIQTTILVPEEVRERLADSKQAAKKMDMGRSNLKLKERS